MNLPLVNISNKGRIIYLFSRDEKGNQIIRRDNTFFPFFFEPDENGNFRGYDNVPLKKIFVSAPKEVPRLRSLSSYSSDIPYVNVFLTYKVDKIDPCLIKYFMMDIEVLADEFPDVKEAKYPICCITIWNSMNKEYKTWWLGDYVNDKFMLTDFIKYIKEEKPDILFAWHNTKFDYPYLHNCGNQLNINFAKEISPINQVRLGEEKDMFYPAGISIVDYLSWFRKVNMREASYALDYIAEKYLGKGKKYKNPYFGELNEEIKLRNKEDVEILVSLEEKEQLIPYYNELRRISKVKWEDLYYNSRIIEMLLLEEAKLQNIVLPNKKKNEQKIEFKGAIRDSLKIGIVFDAGKFDLTSAYPSVAKNFCLDSQNIIIGETKEKYIEVNGIKFKQNENALLPSIIGKILKIKDKLKKGIKDKTQIKKEI